MKKVIAIAMLAASTLVPVFAATPQETIAALDARLGKIGEPKLEGSEKAGELSVPGLFYGTRKINGNFDVVDEIKKTFGSTATVFVRSGEEFVRISTNVLTPEGKRGIGTQLAHNKAYESVKGGQSFCGPVDVLGTAFDTCYNPIKDKAGKVIGVTYIGYKK